MDFIFCRIIQSAFDVLKIFLCKFRGALTRLSYKNFTAISTQKVVVVVKCGAGKYAGHSYKIIGPSTMLCKKNRLNGTKLVLKYAD